MKDFQLTNDFNTAEMRCRCCGKLAADPAFMFKLQKCRDLFGRPMLITSGYRCESYNMQVGGVKDSEHLKGNAADIAVTAETKYDLLAAAIRSGLHGIGIGHDFLHLDNRTAGTIWVYE